MRNAHGSLRLCAPSAKIVQVLEVTHLLSTFDSYDSEDEAITAFYQGAGSGAGTTRPTATILCVDASSDVQALVRELLGQAGYGVLSAGNLPDGLILLQATRPKLVIVSADLRLMRGTRSGDTFNMLVDALPMIELPSDFSILDAGEAGQRLLVQVRAATATA